jgi:hypothetical protein
METSQGRNSSSGDGRIARRRPRSSLVIEGALGETAVKNTDQLVGQLAAGGLAGARSWVTWSGNQEAAS